MTIDEAIKQLEEAKANGVKNIVFAYWVAREFQCIDDEHWAADAAYVEDQMDWSAAHDAMRDILTD